ncbi:MAG: hypothetical protein HQ515_20380, partial [Phycisphaeraceae bacterium]|nr:hypothetical protein [Phycisphaeraceae bacterium]
MMGKKAFFMMCLMTMLGLTHTLSAKQSEPSKALHMASYATSRHVEQLATDEAIRTQAWSTIRRFGITKLYVEVYRGGHVVSREHLIFVRDWLQDKGIKVVGGIATVPGGDFGVRQKGGLGWFNWQNEKTQQDLETVVRMAAVIFDTFIVDDFLCTGDISTESRTAKGDRTWSEYRLALLTDLADSIFVAPAKEVNPTITMIVKYPQWYDRFHLFGYDTRTFPEIFDKVWVGTETRGRNTQRFGFVQPYEGFVNFRWLAGIAGDKIGGAWFDHGDCAEHDFLDQAYTSVLAGAAELVFFNFANIMAGHPDHEKVIAQSMKLGDLATFVRQHPVMGIPAYKPPNSDPAGDMYIMDFLGMLGIPIIPVHEFPQDAPIVFLPAQAAADPDLLDHIHKARAKGTHLIFTTNLLITSAHGDELARMAGVDPDLKSEPIRAQLTQDAVNKTVTIDLESPVECAPGPGNILCVAGHEQYALLKTHNSPKGRVVLLNTHTYNQADFDAVGEVLLCPRPLGLLDMQKPALSTLREAFGGTVFDGPAGVTYHPFGAFASGHCVIQNFNDKPVTITLTLPIQDAGPTQFVEALSGKPVSVRPTGPKTRTLPLPIPPRDRVWIR